MSKKKRWKKATDRIVPVHYIAMCRWWIDWPANRQANAVRAWTALTSDKLQCNTDVCAAGCTSRTGGSVSTEVGTCSIKLWRAWQLFGLSNLMAQIWCWRCDLSFDRIE